MNRRAFTASCITCLTGTLIAPLVSSCLSAYYTTGTLENDGISLSPSEFSYVKKDQPALREYVIVRNDALEFPIYVYRFSETEYSAVLMKCTHQGSELQASGDHLHCPAHGSEFSNKGMVAQGPAEKNLRSFKVTADSQKIFIDLRT
jgi:Rieske Fe-S protein